MKKFLVLTIITLFLISCKSSYTLNLDEESFTFKSLHAQKFLDDDLFQREEISIEDSEKIKEIINLLENNLDPTDSGLDSAPIKDSIQLYFDDYYLLLIKNNFYQGKYYCTFYFDDAYKNFTSDDDLLEKITNIIEATN